jgi:fructose-bisphosphate aldolase class II
MKFVIAVLSTIVLGSGADAFTAGVRKSARVASVSIKDKIAGELDLPCEDACALESFPNMPPSVHPGVVTGQALVDLLEDAKTRGELSCLGIKSGCMMYL